MLTTDVRFMAADARVSTTFARLGLVAEYGLSWLLPRVVGTGRAIELLMSGRIIDSDEALRIGLVHEVVSDGPVLDRAMAWAHEVAAKCSPRSTSTIKRQVYDDLDRPRGEAFDRSLELMLGRSSGATCPRRSRRAARVVTRSTGDWTREPCRRDWRLAQGRPHFLAEELEAGRYEPHCDAWLVGVGRGLHQADGRARLDRHDRAGAVRRSGPTGR